MLYQLSYCGVIGCKVTKKFPIHKNFIHKFVGIVISRSVNTVNNRQLQIMKRTLNHGAVGRLGAEGLVRRHSTQYAGLRQDAAVGEHQQPTAGGMLM